METSITKEQEQNIEQVARFVKLADNFADYCLEIGVTVEKALPMFTEIAERKYAQYKAEYNKVPSDDVNRYI